MPTKAQTLNHLPLKITGTVGKPLPYLDVKITAPGTGDVVPLGERGEFCYRGFAAMQGYYQMPDKTAETIDREGWVHSGDLATMNVQGYINIVGRLKDMVIRGGENLFPREIEEFLLRHPGVADIHVVGVPDAYFGEELLAAVRAKDGVALSEADLRVLPGPVESPEDSTLLPVRRVVPADGHWQSPEVQAARASHP